jgi:hypothetical protein
MVNGIGQQALLGHEILRPAMKSAGSQDDIGLGFRSWRELLDNGIAKYVRLTDEEECSVFNQLINFAYSPDQVCVIEYRTFGILRNLYLQT